MEFLGEFASWIEGGAANRFMLSAGWLIPLVQTIHILGLAVIFASMALLDARLMGVGVRGMSIGELSAQYLPTFWIALAVMLLTGGLLISAEPSRALLNSFFWIKMLAVLAAVSMTLVALVVGRRLEQGAGGATVWMSRGLGAALLAAWVLVVFCGRWIAYSGSF